MVLRSQADLYALHAQHSLQSSDFLAICQLANVDGIFESAENWSFEQFLGFALYQFITTECAETRQQLCQLLPKFGSAAVLPLVKITHHLHTPASVRQRSLQILEKFEAYPLIIGLKPVLQHDSATELLPIVMRVLVSLTNNSPEPVISLLAQLLPPEHWQLIEDRLHTKANATNLHAIGADRELPVSTERTDIELANLPAQSDSARRQHQPLTREAAHLSLCNSK